MADSNVSSRRNQHIAALIAVGTTFAAGMAFGWTSPVESQIVEREDGTCERAPCVSKNEFTWVATCVRIGSLALGFLAAPLMSRVGRKPVMVGYFVPLILGWAVLTLAYEVWMLYLGRLLIGIGIGGGGVLVPIYLGEISETPIRGMLLTYIQVNLNLGTLFSYVLGLYFQMLSQTVISTALVVAYFFALFLIPESPHYFVSKNDISAAKKSLKWLRGREFNPESEISEIKSFQGNKETPPALLQVKSLLTDRRNRKALLIVCGLMASFQMTGVNAVLFYTSSIFADAQINMDPDVAAVFIGVCVTLASLTSSLLIDSFGRKPLLVVSYVVQLFCFLVMGTYSTIKISDPQAVEPWSLVPVVMLCVFVFMNSVGAAPIAFVMVGEMFDQSVKDVGAAISLVSNYVFSIAATMLFPLVSEAMGAHAAFFGFSGFITLSLLFVVAIVPETKGKSFEEIQNTL